MDLILSEYPTIHEDEDLLYFDGVATQKDLTKTVEYGKAYFEKYISYEGTPTAISLNKGRTSITEKYCKNPILDIGIGSGEFIKSSKLKTYGFDINPYGVKWLKFNKIYINPYELVPENICGWTFWDSLEHFQNPQEILKLVKIGHYIFISIPIFANILDVKKSKHFRRDEHFYYFSHLGLVNYISKSGFRLLEHLDFEIKSGRESIFTFVFQRQS